MLKPKKLFLNSQRLAQTLKSNLKQRRRSLLQAANKQKERG